LDLLFDRNDLGLKQTFSKQKQSHICDKHLITH
jgi:hypothetical protein